MIHIINCPNFYNKECKYDGLCACLVDFTEQPGYVFKLTKMGTYVGMIHMKDLFEQIEREQYSQIVKGCLRLLVDPDKLRGVWK